MAEAQGGRNKFARRTGVVVTLPLALVILVLHAGWGRHAAAPRMRVVLQEAPAGTGAAEAERVELLVR